MAPQPLREGPLKNKTSAASRGCLKNRKYRLFLQTAVNPALKSLGIRKDSCVFCLVFSCCLRKIRQFLYFQTSPNLRRMFYFVRIRQRPFSRLTGQRRAAPIPWTQPWGRCSLYKHSARSIVGGAACISAAPPHCSRRSRLKFFAEAFFKKAGKFFAIPFFKKGMKFFAEAFFKNAGSGLRTRRHAQAAIPERGGRRTS